MRIFANSTHRFLSKYIRGRKLVRFLYEITDKSIEWFVRISCNCVVRAISMYSWSVNKWSLKRHGKVEVYHLIAFRHIEFKLLNHLSTKFNRCVVHNIMTMLRRHKTYLSGFYYTDSLCRRINIITESSKKAFEFYSYAKSSALHNISSSSTVTFVSVSARKKTEPTYESLSWQ